LSKFTSRRLGNAAAVHPPGAYFRMLRGPVTECNHQSRLGLRCMRFFRLPAETCRFSISDAATTSPVSCFKIPPAVEARRAAVDGAHHSFAFLPRAHSASPSIPVSALRHTFRRDGSGANAFARNSR
jgi:hypothetical protein